MDVKTALISQSVVISGTLLSSPLENCMIDLGARDICMLSPFNLRNARQLGLPPKDGLGKIR